MCIGYATEPAVPFTGSLPGSLPGIFRRILSTCCLQLHGPIDELIDLDLLTRMHMAFPYSHLKTIPNLRVLALVTIQYREDDLGLTTSLWGKSVYGQRGDCARMSSLGLGSPKFKKLTLHSPANQKRACLCLTCLDPKLSEYRVGSVGVSQAQNPRAPIPAVFSPTVFALFSKT